MVGGWEEGEEREKKKSLNRTTDTNLQVLQTSSRQTLLQDNCTLNTRGQEVQQVLHNTLQRHAVQHLTKTRTWVPGLLIGSYTIINTEECHHTCTCMQQHQLSITVSYTSWETIPAGRLSYKLQVGVGNNYISILQAKSTPNFPTNEFAGCWNYFSRLW